MLWHMGKSCGWVLAGVLVFASHGAGCGGDAPAEAPQAPAAPSAPPAPEPTPPPERAPEPPTELPTDLGWTEPPAAPSAAQWRANQAALRHHRAERFEAARDGFAAVVAEAPGYHNARFNLACAHTKLGDLEAASRELRTLLERDLPTYGPRLDEDEDLAPLRTDAAGEALAAYRARVTRGYEAALEAGAPIAWEQTVPNPRRRSEDDEGYHTRLYAQAGVWWPAERRFVPMAPRVHVDSDFLMYAHAVAWLHRSRRTAISVTANSNAADMSTLDPVVIQIHRAPTGEALHRRTIPNPEEWMLGSVRIRPTPEGARFESQAGEGFVGPRGAPEGPTLQLLAEASSEVQLEPSAGLDGVEVVGRTLRIGAEPGGREVNLPSIRDTDHGVSSVDDRVLPLGTTHALVLTTQFVDMGTDGQGHGAHVLTRVDRRDGATEELRRGEGPAHAMSVGEGALVQLGGEQHFVAATGPPAALPAGLVLAPRVVRWDD